MVTSTEIGVSDQVKNRRRARSRPRWFHPTVPGVLLALRNGPAYPSDLAVTLGVSRQVMSNQLACLRGCGLVEAVSEGRRASYRLTEEHLTSALGELLHVTLAVEPDCCTGEGCTCA
ncbi:MAG TPA: ArsR family transcriptional regulator [Microbacterium sp.]|uniref:helix-turn-helix domain-containing protein n=1 Tax=unclassified Microbacterium TaxID=2609290 RepID=UPI000C523B41|nr:transcriptional regulator [Microbacterium sp.]HBS09888.1 ArsR family transcriptional regulator [Microbacterium sp.]HBU41474.1 ArsR family transcriptional regulator [Microbacterium sp.]HCU78077.1 ArsR family transcriptional regulator [Microbacterium sp.]